MALVLLLHRVNLHITHRKLILYQVKVSRLHLVGCTQLMISSAPPQTRQRSLSPAQLRKKTLLLPSGTTFSKPRSYTVEAVCAIAHPVPTHALASSLCMSHLLTGSDDGYIRDYDIFSALNGKTFLTAPQRHHCGVVEGIMKAGQIRCWWENPDISRFNGTASVSDDPSISPVYSLLMHSDALWSLAGSNVCSQGPTLQFPVTPNIHFIYRQDISTYLR